MSCFSHPHLPQHGSMYGYFNQFHCLRRSWVKQIYQICSIIWYVRCSLQYRCLLYYRNGINKSTLAYLWLALAMSCSLMCASVWHDPVVDCGRPIYIHQFISRTMWNTNGDCHNFDIGHKSRLFISLPAMCAFSRTKVWKKTLLNNA